jgi:PHD/YefM family antitoxin component YafN of YafNO toxin-antitoxin module
MIASEHTQSLSDFRKKAAATIERLNETGEAEIITVNGEARAVLLSPAVYDAMARESQLNRDVEAFRKANKEIEEGKYQEVGAFFEGVPKNSGGGYNGVFPAGSRIRSMPWIGF